MPNNYQGWRQACRSKATKMNNKHITFQNWKQGCRSKVKKMNNKHIALELQHTPGQIKHRNGQLTLRKHPKHAEPIRKLQITYSFRTWQICQTKLKIVSNTLFFNWQICSMGTKIVVNKILTLPLMPNKH